MKLLIPIVFILFCQSLCAQIDETIHISGIIVNAEDSSPVPFVHIINITKRSGLTADQYGRFSFHFPKSDTLVFSSVGFKHTRITFKDSTKSSFDNLRIFLYPETITLNPVEIRAYNLEEILNKVKEKDISMEQVKPQPLFEPKERIEKPAVSLGSSQYGGATLDGAITAFANLFSNDYKQRQKLKDIYEKESLQNQKNEVKRQLENTYIEIASKITGLQGSEFNGFLELYMPDLQFLLYASDYDLSHRIYKDYRDFRYRFKLEEVSIDELIENAKFRK